MEMMNTEELICLLKNELKARKMTAKDLAERVDATPSSMSRWLSGKRKIPFDVASRCLYEFGYPLMCGMLPRQIRSRNEN